MFTVHARRAGGKAPPRTSWPGGASRMLRGLMLSVKKISGFKNMFKI